MIVMMVMYGWDVAKGVSGIVVWYGWSMWLVVGGWMVGEWLVECIQIAYRFHIVCIQFAYISLLHISSTFDIAG